MARLHAVLAGEPLDCKRCSAPLYDDDDEGCTPGFCKFRLPDVDLRIVSRRIGSDVSSGSSIFATPDSLALKQAAAELENLPPAMTVGTHDEVTLRRHQTDTIAQLLRHTASNIVVVANAREKESVFYQNKIEELTNRIEELEYRVAAETLQRRNIERSRPS